MSYPGHSIANLCKARLASGQLRGSPGVLRGAKYYHSFGGGALVQWEYWGEEFLPVLTFENSSSLRCPGS